jgi:prepilin-type N-terminal cleavage/methylation domain-containing protein
MPNQNLTENVVRVLPRKPNRPRVRGFTLLEILTVIAIVAILTSIVIPAAGALQGAGGMDRATSDIASTLQQARAYAMGNNTYVYVGVQEVSPISANATSGTGRLVVTAIASVDGSRPAVSDWGTSALSSDVVTIQKPEIFDGVHLTTDTALANSGNMERPTPSSSADLGGLGADQADWTTSFPWPLSGTPRNTFSKVVEFDPQGVARVQVSAQPGYDPSIPSYIEIALVPAHGTQVAAAVPNQAAIQVDGVTGAVRIYRP